MGESLDWDDVVGKDIFLPSRSTYPLRIRVREDESALVQAESVAGRDSAVAARTDSTKRPQSDASASSAGKKPRIEPDDSSDEEDAVSSRGPQVQAQAANAFSLMKRPQPAASQSSSSRGNWADALLDYIRHPERHRDDIYHMDKDTVTVRDKFPKAKHHYLIIPTREIDGLASLRVGDVPLLIQMKERAEWVESRLLAADTSLKFRTGFHAIPSMRQLHLHLISQDFSSDSLKNKKHWNSFTTAFFVAFEDVVAMLSETNRVHFNANQYEALLKADMRCHVCGTLLRNMPALKTHIKTHLP